MQGKNSTSPAYCSCTPANPDELGNCRSCGRPPRPEATCGCGQWPVSEYGTICPSCPEYAALPLLDANSANPLEASIARLRAEAVACHICNARVREGLIAEGDEFPLCEDCEGDSSREGRAAVAYLSTFRGPWGLKASTEDAVLSVICALYPYLGHAHDSVGIEWLRSHPNVSAAVDTISEDLEQEGMGAREIGAAAVPLLDEALVREVCEYAAGLGLDCDFEHGDSYFIAQALSDVLALPEAERARGVARLNEGWSIESVQAEGPRRCPSCANYYYGAEHTCIEYDAANPCSVPGCEAPTVWVSVAAPGTGSGRTCKAGHYVGTCRELTAEEVR